MTGPLFPVTETFNQMASRVCTGLLLLTLSGYLISLGYNAPTSARVFLTGAGAMLIIGMLIAVAA
jgi:hypothetical protein